MDLCTNEKTNCKMNNNEKKIIENSINIENNKNKKINRFVRPRHGSDAAVYGEDITINNKMDDMDNWSKHPRTLTIGIMTLGFFLYAAFNDISDHYDTLYNIKRGIKYSCIFFLIYCVLQLRDGHFIRPHPAVWRFITGVFILYEMVLIFLLFQNTKDARLFFKHLDPNLGKELMNTKSYAEDCRIYTPEDPISCFRNISNTFYDQFVLMHFFGWFIGTLMVRDYIICWLISILFEFYELTFEHWLPNFKECWWDHLFFDILICNALGIYFGMKVCYFFEMKNYNWIGIHQIKDVKKKIIRFISQFTPFEWIAYDWWKMSFVRIIRVIFMIVALSVMMVNSFFLKTVLWIPAENWLNVVRLIIWYSAGAYAIAEYYIFCTSKDDQNTNESNNLVIVKKLGPRAWLGIGVVITEVCIILKHGKGMFITPFPTVIKLGWLGFFIICIGMGLLYYIKTSKKI